MHCSVGILWMALDSIRQRRKPLESDCQFIFLGCGNCRPVLDWALGRSRDSTEIVAGLYCPLFSSGTTGSITAAMAYTYAASGALKGQTLPSGRQLTITLDDLGRPITLSGKVSNQTKQYLSSVQYNASGKEKMWQWPTTATGSPVAKIEFGYNDLQQMNSTVFSVGSAPQWSYGLQYDKTTACPGGITQCNNGNVGQTTVQLGSLASRSQNYTYDTVNRLKSANEAGGWAQTYVYDSFGNRAVLAGASQYLPSLWTPPVTADDTAQVAGLYLNNRFKPNVASHDSAGNVISIVGPPVAAFTYDSESRQVGATVGSDAGSYQYDGEGRRVSKTSASGTTVFVYDAHGGMVAQYGALSDTTDTQWVVADHLGSTRALVGPDGTVTKGFDYLPFGEDVPVPVNGRGAPYQAAFNSQALEVDRFTGKERDAETGLDYFGARYMSAAQGRFTSVDPAMESEDVGDPQTWNRYSYVFNRPLALTDPDGRCPNCFTAAGGAAVGGGLGFIGAVATQYLSGQKINYRDALAAGAGGAVSGAIAGFTLGGSLIAEASIGAGTVLATGVVSNVAGGVVTRTLDSDGLIGGAAGYQIQALLRAKLPLPEWAKVQLRQAKRLRRVAKGRVDSRPASVATLTQNAADAEKFVDNVFFVSPASMARGAAKKATKEVVKSTIRYLAPEEVKLPEQK